MDLNNGNIKFPPQKKSLVAKTKAWRKQHLDWADKNSHMYNAGVRKSLHDKKINLDLYSGIVLLSEIKQLLNPFNKEEIFLPKKIPHYPEINKLIDILVGEENNRKNDIVIRAINTEAISSLEETMTEQAKAMIVQFLQTEGGNQQEDSLKASSLQNYFSYNIQEMMELDANWIFQHYSREVSFNTKLNEGFKNALLVGEDGPYQFDIIAGEPVMEVLNPKKVYTYRSGNSPWIQDSDIIIIDEYKSPGQLIDLYYEDLTPADQKYLEEFGQDPLGTNDDYNRQSDKFVRIDDVDDGVILPMESVEGILSFAYAGGLGQSDYIDAEGNIRELKVLWRSKKKILKVKSYNLETGEPEFNYRSEIYKINKELGEEAEDFWVNEIWEATKIGKNIYTRMRPKPVQFRRLNNLSKCHAGIIGLVYTTNQLKPYSFMDKAKPYQYLYDVIHDRLMKLISNNIGAVLEVDLAKIPAKYEPEVWMHILRNENIAFVDSFKEGNVGQSTGKLVGHFNTTNKSLDLDLSASIKLYMELLGYIKQTMSDLVGITPQRLGQITNRETVGGVERSVTQSSHITAEYFALHDQVRLKCAEALLETAKIALKGSNKKIHFVTNDGIRKILEINGDEFAAMDHGLFMENSLDQAGLRQKIEQFAFAWAQNETVLPSTIIKILTDPSLSSIQRRIENDIQSKQERDQQAQQSQQESQERMAQMQQEAVERANQIEQLRMQLEDLINQRDNETKLEMKRMELSNVEEEDTSIDTEKLKIQREKSEKDFKHKMEALNETIRHNKEAEKISRIKKPTTK